MKRITTVLAVVLGSAALGAAAVQAQGIGIGARVGTLGVGAEAAIAVGERLQLRGGVSLIPLEPKGTFSDVEYEVEPPSPLATIGADLYLTRSVRLFGGVLLGADETNILADFTGTVQIGDRTYQKSELGDLEGTVESASAAPFIGIGFGRHVSSGLGLTLDLGAAFMGESDLVLRASGPIASNATFQAELEKERQQVEEDLRKYTKVYPIVNIGLKFGLGF